MSEEQEGAARQRDRNDNEIGALGWFSIAGFVIMGALYVLSVTTDAAALTTPMGDLAIAIVAGIGALLFWFGNDPTAGRTGNRNRSL